MDALLACIKIGLEVVVLVDFGDDIFLVCFLVVFVTVVCLIVVVGGVEDVVVGI